MDVMSFFADSSLCSAVFFLPWCNADHVFVSIHRRFFRLKVGSSTAFNHSSASCDDFLNYLREEMFQGWVFLIWVHLLLLLSFVSGSWLGLMYPSLKLSGHTSFISLFFSS